MQRTIEIADFELPRGAVKIQQLMAMESRLSLKGALAKVRCRVTLIGPEHAIWIAAARLFPEIRGGMLRAELIDLGKLPAWAAPPAAETQQAA